jgi:hypothetical protein
VPPGRHGPTPGSPDLDRLTQLMDALSAIKIPRRYTGPTVSEQARGRLWPMRAERSGRSAPCPPVGIPCRQLIRTLLRIPLTLE